MSTQAIKIVVSLFIAGLSFGSGPCLASCGPILISYIAGTKKKVIEGVKVYILFSSARILVYLVLGLLVSFMGRFAVERFTAGLAKYVFLIGGGFIILVGILMALGKRLEIPVCQFLQKRVLEQDNKSVIVLGLVIGLLPCAPLIAILSYIGLISKTWAQGLFYSFSFGLGTFVSPLIILAIFAGLIPKFLLEKKASYARVFSLILGLIIIFLGIQLIQRAF